jgi:predicted PurR-regulated permease PerM
LLGVIVAVPTAVVIKTALSAVRGRTNAAESLGTSQLESENSDVSKTTAEVVPQ